MTLAPLQVELLAACCQCSSSGWTARQLPSD
jgi:hypothetical protein